MDEQMKPMEDQRSAGRLDLLLITQAYNRREITFEEWLRLSQEWAEAVINHCRPSDDVRLPRKPAAPG